MKQDLDLLLINPGARQQMYGDLGFSLSGIEPPLWCGLIAAFIREQGHSIKIIDAEAENWSPETTAKKIARYDPLLVGLIVLGNNPSASSTPKMTAVGETLTALKKESPHIKTIIDGLHPSALPKRTLKEEEVDFVSQGEGFYTILQLLEILKSGEELGDKKIPGLWHQRDNEIISNPSPPLIDPNELPCAAWDLLPMDRYRAHNWHCFDHIAQRKPYAVVYTSLGCPFNCSYCNIHTLYNNKPGIRFRSPEKVVKEIDFLVENYNVKNLKIIDELFCLKEEHVIHICDLIVQGGYDLNIWCYARIDTITEKMLKKMKQAGVNWLAIGFESASKEVREGVSKTFKESTVGKTVQMIRSADINIIGNFIFGLPDDDLETMQETLDTAKEFNFEYVNFYTAMAYPGSQLYDDAAKRGIKLPEEWHGYGQYSEETLPLPTKHLSAAEVLRFRDKAFREYFSNPEYLEMIREKFGPEAVDHIKDMLKHEIHRKHT